MLSVGTKSKVKVLFFITRVIEKDIELVVKQKGQRLKKYGCPQKMVFTYKYTIVCHVFNMSFNSCNIHILLMLSIQGEKKP